jgi:hypothetical protein
LFAASLQPTLNVSTSATRTSRSRWDMDPIALALIVGLAAIGLAWITFVDRI